ncbi:MAG: Ig domain-containing protein [Velocimicrobium sp.]
MDKNNRKMRTYAICGFLILVFTLVFSWKNYSNEIVKAAVGAITINDDAGSGTFDLRKQNLPAYVENIKSGTSITWTTSDTGIFKINKDTSAKVTTTSSTVTLQAVGIGTATLTAEFVDGDSINQTLTRVINVPSAISENAAYFGLLNDTATESVMILNLTTRATGTLGLLYDVSPGVTVTWTSANSYVVSMDATGYSATNSTGYFRTTGTGKTTITVSYTDDGKLVTSSVDVYVGPKVTVANVEESKLYVEKGDYIDLGGNTENNNATIGDKVNWVLTSESGTVLEQSTTASKQYLSSSPYSSQLEVSGRAGYYYLYVFTAGAYTSSDDLENNTINQFLKKTIELHILPKPISNIANPVSLQVSDSYDVADIFNMTVDDFNKYFDYSCTPATRGDFSNGVFVAQTTGAANLTINYKNGMKEAFATFLHGTPSFPYTISVNIYKGFMLDRSEASIYVGGSMKLSTVYGANKGKITWTTEDKSYVTVVGNDANAVITGVKSTGDSSVIITASMTLEDGRTLTASCNVKVGTTATSITLNETDLTMKLGATSTITASYKPTTTTTVDLKWILSDDSIVDLSVNSEKSVVVTAKKVGTTILTAVNTDNYITAYCTITVSSAIKSLSLNYTQKNMTLSQEVLRLRATYTPSDATQTELVWGSSDTSVATVDDGLVTFVGPGSTIITVQPKWNENFAMAQCNLTITASPTAFAFDKTLIALEAGETSTIKPILTATNSTTTITWKSMNPSIATVNNGVVTAISAGQTYIIATTKEGFVASCLVTVTQKASAISLSTYNIKLAVGEKTTVTATPNPITSTETTFEWTSKDTKIATVSGGIVTGVSSGSTIILVKSAKGAVVYLYVSVYDEIKSMTLNYSNKELAKGAKFTLKPIFTPENVTNTAVTWKSLNPKIATITDKGVVKGVKGGAAVITCTSDDGGYLSTCLVNVVEPITSIKLNYTYYKLGLGDKKTLKATIVSNASSNNKVKWSSSNTKIATVSSTGIVRGKKLGYCIITAKTTDGTGKKASCKIRVIKEVTRISLNKSVMTVVVNNSVYLKATVKPSNATYKTVKWTSADKNVAIVNSKGKVTGLSVGTTSVKASAKDYSKESDICYIKVINAIPTSSILLAAKDLVMIKGQSQMLSYTVTPSNHTDKVYFASDNKSVASITSTGKIYARRTGTATITVTSASGKQSMVNLTVIGLNKTSLTLEQYTPETLTVEGAPSGVTWYSGDASIATVSGGVVLGRKQGTTTIYARVSGIILSCRVTVTAITAY